jgi:transposase
VIYVGIDVAKETHVAAVMNTDGVVLLEPFAFQNNHDGFQQLKAELETLDRNELLIGLESTAHYAENLIFFLHAQGYRLAVINPVQTAAVRKTGIRKTKTDKIDSLLICKTLALNSFRFYTENDVKTLQLKSLCRFRQKLKKSKARLKIQLVSYVDMIFPELQFFFKSGLHIKTCYELLKSYSSPDDIAALHLTKLSNLLSKASRGRFGKEDARSLKSLAASSVGVKNTYISIQITQTIAQIELIESQLTELEQIIGQAMDELDSVIMTVPGIGKLNGAMILGEIGDIHRFSHPSKLLAYAGLDPVVSQSGKFTAKRTRMSKRGSKVLRYALINAAWNVSLNNDTFKRYFDSKIAQGHSHYDALAHTAHKLVRVLFKLLTDNVAFALV